MQYYSPVLVTETTIETTMTKATRAENLIQLIEWLRLGRKFHIHKLFLEYLNMSDIIRLCLVSNHYNKKYLNYCYNYFMASSSCILNFVKNNKGVNYYTKEKNEKLIHKRFPEYRFPEYRIKIDCPSPRETICYNSYVELKTLYGINNKITNLVDKYFGRSRIKKIDRSESIARKDNSVSHAGEGEQQQW